jgi:hypothetical protein
MERSGGRTVRTYAAFCHRGGRRRGGFGALGAAARLAWRLLSSPAMTQFLLYLAYFGMVGGPLVWMYYRFVIAPRKHKPFNCWRCQCTRAIWNGDEPTCFACGWSQDPMLLKIGAAAK